MSKQHTKLMPVTDYRFGQIVINGTRYRSDVIIVPGRVIGNWWRKQGHSLCLEDIGVVLEAEPEVLVIGQGASSLMQVPPQLRHHLEQRGIRLLIGPTAWAVGQFNQEQSKAVAAAAFHLTC